MALKKTKEVDNSGYTADYHRIIGIKIDKLLMHVEITVGLYKDQNCAQQEGRAPSEINIIGYDFEPHSWPFTTESGNAMAVGYEILKAPRPVVDQIRNEITDEIEEVTRETNWYADAESV